MNMISLSGEPRKILGKKVKKLRAEGLIPAHIFGHKIKTSHIQVNEQEFSKVEKEAGETGVVELKVGGEVHPVLIRAIQQDPVTYQLLHIDFYQVNLKEKVKVNVPIEIVGESPAIESKIGLLLTPLSEIEVEALPTDLPESIKVDISKLSNLDDSILVKDLKVSSGVEILTDLEETIVKISELVTREAEKILAEETAEREEVVTEEGVAAKGEEAIGEGEETPASGETTEGAEKAQDSGKNPPPGGSKEEKSE